VRKKKKKKKKVVVLPKKRGGDVSPLTRIKAYGVFMMNGGPTTRGAAAKTARELGIDKKLPKTLFSQVKARQSIWTNDRCFCGAKRLLEKHPEYEGKILDALEKDDEATYEELANTLNVPKSTLHRACMELGVKMYVSNPKPPLTEEGKKVRVVHSTDLLEGTDKNGDPKKDQRYVFHQDEKWFYQTWKRAKKKYIPGKMKKKCRRAKRRHQLKVMVSACVGRPIPEHNFDGKISFRRVAYNYVAKKTSYKKDEDGKKVLSHKKGDVYPVDCEMNAKRFEEELKFIGTEMRHKLNWVDKETQLTLQIDSAGGHGTARGHGNFKKLAEMMLKEFNILLVKQPARSPEFNYLDLMVWKSIAAKVVTLSKKDRRDKEVLFKTCVKAFRQLDPAVIDLAAYVVLDVARCCVEDKGENTRSNGNHEGAWKAQLEALGKDGLAAMQKLKSRRGKREAIGGLCVGDPPEKPKKMPRWMKLLQGKCFKDEDGLWKIYKVEYKCDDDYPDGGWVAWYKPKEAQRATPENKHFSPVSWLGGRGKIVANEEGVFKVKWR